MDNFEKFYTMTPMKYYDCGGDFSKAKAQAMLSNENEDIISVCDKLIISLNLAIQNAEEILEMLYEMKRKYSNPPL